MSPTLNELNDPDYEIRHFANEKRWVIGPNSKLGINRVWKIREHKTIEDQPPTNFGMQNYMQMGAWLAEMNIIIPHPQQHLGARLLGHHQHLRTTTQFCGAFLELWRAKDAVLFKHPEENWESLAELRRDRARPCKIGECLFEYYKAESAERESMVHYESCLGRITKKQTDAMLAQTDQLDEHSLIEQLLRTNEHVLKNREWQEPRSMIELRIVEAAFLFFTLAKTEADQPLLRKILDIIRSGHLIIYCDPRLPGHEITFNEGCASRGLKPRENTLMSGRGVSGMFDYGMAMSLWKDGTSDM